MRLNDLAKGCYFAAACVDDFRKANLELEEHATAEAPNLLGLEAQLEEWERTVAASLEDSVLYPPEKKVPSVKRNRKPTAKKPGKAKRTRA